LDTDYIKYCWS